MTFSGVRIGKDNEMSCGVRSREKLISNERPPGLDNFMKEKFFTGRGDRRKTPRARTLIELILCRRTDFKVYGPNVIYEEDRRE